MSDKAQEAAPARPDAAVPFPRVVRWTCPADVAVPAGGGELHYPVVEAKWERKREELIVAASFHLQARLEDGNTLTVPLHLVKYVTPNAREDEIASQAKIDETGIMLHDAHGYEEDCGQIARDIQRAQMNGCFSGDSDSIVSNLKQLFPGVEPSGAVEARRALALLDDLADAERGELFQLKGSRSARRKKPRRLNLTAGFFATLRETMRKERRIKGVAMLHRLENSARVEMQSGWNETHAYALREASALEEAMRGDRSLQGELRTLTKQYRRELKAEGRKGEFGKYFRGVRPNITRRAVARADKRIQDLMRKTPLDTRAVTEEISQFVSDFRHVNEIVERSSVAVKLQKVDAEMNRGQVERQPAADERPANGHDQTGDERDQQQLRIIPGGHPPASGTPSR